MQKVFVYARTHDQRGGDKVLVIRENEVLTLPQGEVPRGKKPAIYACEVLDRLSGLSLYPDRRNFPNSTTLCDSDFLHFPILEGRIISGDTEVLCYGVKVNESRVLKDDALWMPWWTLRWDERMSSMTRFVVALLYAGIAGWEMRLDEGGNWTLPYLCTEGTREHTVDEILSGKMKVEVYDSLHEILNKNLRNQSTKSRDGDNWVFKLFRRLGML